MPAKLTDLVKICFLLLALLVIPGIISSQTPKGFVTTENGTVPEGKTRALVIGISKYEYIDTLQYADRDARIFADYLQQNHFWGIEKDDITLLVNDKAKYGDLTVELQRVALQCKPGDNLLFYFSGHGDVETNTMFNRGYLLAYDTYSSNYMANGLRVDDLKDVIVTLLNKQVKVILITDACRSGNLAGGIKGAEFTASAISTMWKNEIKILSSQAGQLSQESSKWGNGQGVFSYYLIKGLSGEADADKNAAITLDELDTYVGKNVARETDNQQQPIFEGPNKYSTILVKLKAPVNKTTPNKTGNTSMMFPHFRVPDDSCNYYYREMKTAIEEKKFDNRSQQSASILYQRLKTCTKDTGLILQANSQLLSALINKVQEIVNNSFIGKNLVTEENFEEGINLIDQVLQNNDLNLPYKKHWTNLKRYLFVQGKATWYEETENKVPTDMLSQVIDSALQEEPDAAYLLVAKAVVEMRKQNWARAIQLLEQSLVKSPGWLIPKYQLGICYAKKKNFTKALEYYEQVLLKDTLYKTFECTKCILGNMASYALELKEDRKALSYFMKSIDLFPDYSPAYDAVYDYAVEKKDTTLAIAFISALNRYNDTAGMRLERLRFEKDFYGAALSTSLLDPVRSLLKDRIDSADYYYTLGLMYAEQNPHYPDSVVIFYTKAIELDSTEPFYMHAFTDYLVEDRDNETLQDILPKRINNYKDEDKAELQFKLVKSYCDTENYPEAFIICRELHEADYYTCDDLRKLKKVFGKLPEYIEYMKQCKDK